MSFVDRTPFPALVQRWADDLAGTVANEPLFQHTSVFAYHARWNGLVLAAQRWGPLEDTGMVRVGEWVVPLDGSISGRVYRTGKPALIPDIALDPEYRAFPGSRTRSELAVPIVADGATVGVVNLESSRIDSFGIADLDRLRSLADVAGALFADRGLGYLLRTPYEA